ncbi:hypothetical protein PM082_011821 [Marasmius tenuissimus]|nr:hypothetical protein PM082_011821 [Marasmius tenuissimus]
MTSLPFANAQNPSIGDNSNFSVVGRDQYNNYNQLTLANEPQRRRIVVGNAEEEALYAEYRDLRLGDVLIIADLGYILEWEWDESYGEWVMVCERNFSVARVRSGIYSVVSYDGPGRVGGWREDFERFSGISLHAQSSAPQTYFRICDATPNNVQVYGMNRSNNPLLALHNHLSPLAHFLDRAVRGLKLVTQNSGFPARKKKYTVVSYGGSRKQDQWKRDFRRLCREQISRNIRRTGISSTSNIPSVLVLDVAVPFLHFQDHVCTLGRIFFAAALQIDQDELERTLWVDSRKGLILYNQASLLSPNLRLPSPADLIDDDIQLRYLLASSPNHIVKSQLWTVIAEHHKFWAVVERSDMVCWDWGMEERYGILRMLSEWSGVAGWHNEIGARRPPGNPSLHRLIYVGLLGRSCCTDISGGGLHGPDATPARVRRDLNIFSLITPYQLTGRLSLSRQKTRRRETYPNIYLFIRPRSTSIFWSFDRDGQVPITNHLRKSLGLPRKLSLECREDRLQEEAYRLLQELQTAREFASAPGGTSQWNFSVDGLEASNVSDESPSTGDDHEEDLSLGFLFGDNEIEGAEYECSTSNRDLFTQKSGSQDVDIAQNTIGIRKLWWALVSAFATALIVLLSMRMYTWEDNGQRGRKLEFGLFFVARRWQGIAAWCRH